MTATVLQRLATAALAAGVALVLGAVSGSPGPPQPPLAAPPPPLRHEIVTRPVEAPAAHRAPRPVGVEIPAIGVRAPLVSLGLDATGALEVPDGFTEAGWWTGGARPGEPGPAVIAGHVDSTSGPAVFFRLGELGPGDAVIVVRRDGTRVRFVVRSSARYPKARFPTARVYGPTAGPELRLISCSGSFDRETGHYLDNTVVYAAAA